MHKQTDLLTTDEGAKYLRLSPRTLERYRVTGEGSTLSQSRKTCPISPI